MSVLTRLRSVFRLGSRSTSADAAPSWPAHVLVPEAIYTHTRRGLRSHSPATEEHEGVVYWAGTTVPSLDTVVVLSCLVPTAETGPGRFDVSAGAYARIVEAVHDHDLQLLARVHSHPGSWTGHSDKDDGPNLVYDGFYSIVVPDYAANGVQPLTDCGVHRFEDTEFKQLDSTEVAQTFRTITSPPQYIDTRNP